MTTTKIHHNLPSELFGLPVKQGEYLYTSPTGIAFTYVEFLGHGEYHENGVDVYVNDMFIGTVELVGGDWFAQGGDLELYRGSRYFDNVQDAALGLLFTEQAPPKGADRQAENPTVKVSGLGSVKNSFQRGELVY